MLTIKSKKETLFFSDNYPFKRLKNFKTILKI